MSDVAYQLESRLPIDPLGARTVIDYVHHETHEGLFFTAFRYQSLAAASVLSILFTAPSAGSIHLEVFVECDKSGVYTWSKAPNASGGTAITPNNHDMDGTAATLVAAYDPTFVSTGTVLFHGAIGTNAVGVVKVGGASAERDEWILTADELCLLRFTADSATSRTTLIGEFYEER